MTNLSDLNLAERADHRQCNRLIGGMALIGMGLFLFAAQLAPAQWVAMVVLPALGVIFLLWGLLARTAGLLVPGGILCGIGLGAYLVTGPYLDASEVTRGGVFLLSFAAGWALIVILSLLIGQRQLWPLIPGAIMALIGGLLLADTAGLRVLGWVGLLWPLALVLMGAMTLLGLRRR